MPNEDPLAICTLPPEDRAERLTWIRREVLSRAVAMERGADFVVWTLGEAPGLAAVLDALVERERSCCAGIAFSHQPADAPGQRLLRVDGVDPEAPVFASLALPDFRSPEGKRK